MMIVKPNINLIHGDCMEVMADYPDNYFDLAVVDPPYGIGMSGKGDGSGRLTKHRWKQHTVKDWDNKTPSLEYFNELFRVSKNQIIWGANYFVSKMPYESRCWLSWDKMQVFSLADFELAYTSFDKPCRAFRMTRGEATNEKKGQAIHPTQKPVALYDWIFKNYAQPGQRILDTHLGSASSAIAATRHNFSEFVGVEIDREYYEAAVKRFETVTAQIRIF